MFSEAGVRTRNPELHQDSPLSTGSAYLIPCTIILFSDIFVRMGGHIIVCLLSVYYQ